MMSPCYEEHFVNNVEQTAPTASNLNPYDFEKLAQQGMATPAPYIPVGGTSLGIAI